MKLNKNEKIVLKLAGFNTIPDDEDKQIELYEKIEDILLNKGIKNEELNEIGLACESLLDKMEDK